MTDTTTTATSATKITEAISAAYKIAAEMMETATAGLKIPKSGKISIRSKVRAALDLLDEGSPIAHVERRIVRRALICTGFGALFAKSAIEIEKEALPSCVMEQFLLHGASQASKSILEEFIRIKSARASDIAPSWELDTIVDDNQYNVWARKLHAEAEAKRKAA